jgi:hypothetical protein
MLRPTKIASDVTGNARQAPRDLRLTRASLMLKGTGMLPKNVGTLDRDIRLVLGVLLMIPALFILSGIYQIIAGLLAVVLFATAATGFCPLYTVLGIKTNKGEAKQP